MPQRGFPVWTHVALLAAVILGQTPRFQADVTNICIDASVIEDGRVVTGLVESDFITRDEGEPRPILAFSSQPAPMDLLTLLDVSGSMVRDIREMTRNARLALEWVEAHDRVAVIAFSTEPDLIQEFTSDRKALEDAIRRVARRGAIDFVDPTRINASIVASLGLLLRSSEGETGSSLARTRAMLVITDNEGLPVPNEPVIRKLLAADVILHAIVVHRSHFGTRRVGPPRDDPSRPGYTIQNVFHIARATGGDAIVSTTARQVRTSLSEMMTRIRSRYRMWYQAPEAPRGAFRRIQVELSEAARAKYPKAEVRAREGYYVP